MNSIIQWNCRGLRANFTDFRLLCDNYNPIVCCIQETMLTKDDFIIRGFNCIHLTSRDIGGRTQHRELPQDAHKTQTYNVCMTKHSYFPYTSTYSSTRHNTNKTQHPSHPIHKHTTDNILQHSNAIKTSSLTTAATQQTFPQTPTQSLQKT